LGEPKCEEAAKLVQSVNPGVNVTPCRLKIETSMATEILGDADVVVDALDNIADRFVLEEACGKLGIPLVHGALAGFEGQVMTIFPSDPGLKNLYGSNSAASDRSKRPESVLGVPTPTPSLIATLQVMEVIKIILKRGKIFRNAMLHVDMETGEVNEFTFK
jgi:molybdopterin/thiamine biosynthesis adenylyltransferase